MYCPIGLGCAPILGPKPQLVEHWSPEYVSLAAPHFPLFARMVRDHELLRRSTRVPHRSGEESERRTRVLALDEQSQPHPQPLLIVPVELLMSEHIEFPRLALVLICKRTVGRYRIAEVGQARRHLLLKQVTSRLERLENLIRGRAITSLAHSASLHHVQMPH